LWDGIISLKKFHKFFNDGTIKWSHDVWWDDKNLCIIMKANQEMDNILSFDTDLMFPATKMIIDLSGATTLAETIAKIQDDLLSASSISTFWMAATKTSRATCKSTKWLQFNPTIKMAMSDMEKVFSTGTFSEKDLSFLLDCLLQAMKVQQQLETQVSSQKELFSGKVTGKQA